MPQIFNLCNLIEFGTPATTEEDDIKPVLSVFGKYMHDELKLVLRLKVLSQYLVPRGTN